MAKDNKHHKNKPSMKPPPRRRSSKRTRSAAAPTEAAVTKKQKPEEHRAAGAKPPPKTYAKPPPKSSTKPPPKTSTKQKARSLISISNRLPIQKDGIDYHFPPVFFLPTSPENPSSIRIYPERNTNTQIFFRSNGPPPALTKQQTALWRQKYAATACVNRAAFPFGVYRLLGTITRSGVALNLNKKKPAKGYTIMQYPHVNEHRPKSISSGNARNMAQIEFENGELNERKLSSRANEIQNEWKEILAEDVYPGNCPWDVHGDFQFSDDGEHMPLEVLLQSVANSDESDLKAILEACKDLCDPRQLWRIPLVMVYPVVTSEGPTTSRKPETYTIRLAIYMHRLLAEASTISLRIILEALDKDSYLCPRPRVEIPEKQVFASNPYPEVVTDEEEGMVLEEESEEEDRRDQVDESKVSAFSTEGLLKLLENPGTDISDYEKRYAARVNASIKLNLMDYQVHGVAWMLQMEELESINDLLWEEREFWDGGKYYCCPELGEIRLDRPARLKGGLVCDTMGLGKSIEVLSLIVATLPEMKKEAEATGGNHATLIIVPPALVAQWLNEIQKCVGDTLLTVDYFDFRSGVDGTMERRIGNPEADVDIVVTTYNALDKSGSAKVLQSEIWGRIVLDEMQEIRSSTTTIARMCEKLSGSRRWMLSGTPLFDGIGDLRGELNFLKLCPFAASNEDGFFKFMIGDPWENRDPEAIDRLELLSSIMLRRSKNMFVVKTGRSILDRLPPLTVEFQPVQQSDSERALYYFMEAVTGREAESEKESRHKKQTRLCLRFLRELCVSPILLNGGVGVRPQLKNFNTLLISQGRRLIRTTASTSNREKGASRSLNCDDAILHLAHLQEVARTGKGEVSEMAVGFGQGLAGRGRSRAIDADKIEDNKAKLAKAKEDNKAAQRRRAKLRWHLALEMVTTGRYPAPRSKLCGLWRWRSALLTRDKAPNFLRRGWQVSQGFLSGLEFPWAKPNSLHLTEIPDGISAKTVETAIKSCIPQHDPCQVVESNRSSSVWSAYLLFSSSDAMELVLNEAKKTKGILLEDDEDSPVLKQLVQNAEEAYQNATTTSSLNPTNDNTEKRKTARRLLSRMKTHGLSILVAGGNGHPVLEQCQPICIPRGKGLGEQSEPSRLEIRQLTERIEETLEAIQKHEGWASRLGKTVESMSAVESLQALATGNEGKTSCCICLDALGSTKEDGANGQASVSLTKCGHLYCRKCLFDYINQGFAHANCPTCRKSLSYGRDVVHVDPSLKEEEKTGDQFRSLVEEALRMLNKEAGKLPPEMWDHLFKSIELPSLENVSRLRDPRFSAIPGNVLAHFRSCVGNILSPKRADVPDDLEGALSSKVRALIRDIPRDERSVVFATSKNTIEHLAFVLPMVGIPCRSLCSGQPVDDTEQAISEWQSCSLDGSAVLVLLVQSGAAASGVTLTAACKMFMMEPFPRLSEEQQAYGRCHRIGQQHPVHARVYYTPVSVESRLLEWRKRSRAGAEKNNILAEGTTNTKVVYASLDSDDDESFEDDEAGAEEDDEEELAEFLIGSTKA